MNDTKKFIGFLKPIKKQLFFEHTIKELQVLLLLFGMVYFFWMMVSRVWIIASIPKFILISTIAVGLIVLIRIWRKSPSEKDAVLLMNRYIPEDRVLSAYSFNNQPGEMEQLLIRDAVKHMERQLPVVLKRKRKWLYPKILLTAFLFIGFGALSQLLPNSIMEAGIEKGKEEKVVDEMKKNLEEEIEKLENDEEKQILKEHLEDLKKAETSEQFMEGIEKAYNEIELEKQKETIKQQELQNIKKSLEEAGFADLGEAIEKQDQEKINHELKELAENLDQLTPEERSALSEMTGSENLSREDIGDLQEKINEAIAAGNQIQGSNLAQNLLQNQASQLNQSLQNNQLPSLNTAQLPWNNNQNRQNGSQNPSGGNENGNQDNSGSTGENSGSGNQSGNGNNGNNSGSGQNGNEDGSGTGVGQGNQGPGGGQGQGDGGNLGGGSGAGIGQGSRQLLTIPEILEGKFNLEDDFGKLADGQNGTQRETNAPVDKGKIRPYEEVYKEYEKAYLEGLERVNLPSDLETIIKNYFSNVKP